MLFPASGTWMGPSAPSVGAAFLVGWIILSAISVIVLLRLAGESGPVMMPDGNPAYNAPTRVTMVQIAFSCSVFMALAGVLLAYLLAFWPIALVVVVLVLAGTARLLWTGMGAALIRFA